jgi:predicted Zn-ribbon and HTH transcriptional regulator
MAEERQVCKSCGARFTADASPGDVKCSECGSDEIETFVDALYAKEVEYLGKLAEVTLTSGKGVGTQGDQETEKGAAGTAGRYICRKCGFEFVAIPGAEEPPDCPECESDEIDKLERVRHTAARRKTVSMRHFDSRPEETYVTCGRDTGAYGWRRMRVRVTEQ